MTTSAIRSSQDAFNYSDCTFEVRLTKKNLFSSSLRYVYFAPRRMIVCKEPYQQRPEKVISLLPRMSVKWIYNTTKEQAQPRLFKDRALGFIVLSEREEIVAEYYGEAMIMLPLLEYFSKQVFQIDFMKEFKIVSKIGTGKYAKVYKVMRKDSGQFFAVKYLHKQKMKDIDDSEAALDNELIILRMLNHPNCLKMIGVYQDEIGYYIQTELLEEKKSLSEEIQKYKNPQFSFKMVKHILMQLLKGLEYIHEKGIMHRDLKPQNIMFAESKSGSLGQLKLIDFGLAQLLSNNKYIYVHVGTPGYVAPEILANESDNHRYDEKCDLFSIGVIFHTLLTGKTVFPGTKFSQVLEKNKMCQIQLTGPRYEEINRDALDLLAKLLMKDPRRRISAKDALNHKFFLEKGTDLEKLPTYTDAKMPSLSPIQLRTGKANGDPTGMTPVLNQRNHAQMKRPAKTLNSLSEPATFMKDSVFNQLASLKSMKDIDDTSAFTLPTQIDAIYKFTKDLLVLLANIQENKHYFQTNSNRYDDYSPVNILSPPPQERTPNENTQQNSPNKSGQSPIKENEQQEEKQGEQKFDRKQLFINTTKVNEDKNLDNKRSVSPSKRGIINTELANQKEQQYRGKISMEQPTQNNPCDEDEQEAEDALEEDLRGNNNVFHFNHTLDLEKKQSSLSPLPLSPHAPFAAKNNMILNEISSPISPPPQYKQYNQNISEQHQGSPVRPPLRLRIERVPFSSSSFASPQNAVFSPLPSDGRLEQGQNTRQNTKEVVRYPKEIINLIEYFPQDMFSCYLHRNIEEIEKGMPKRVYKLGIFLLFGQEMHKQPDQAQIDKQIEEISSKKFFNTWFIDMIKSMLDPSEAARPTLTQLSQSIQQKYQ